jgi:hypothetical protein
MVRFTFPPRAQAPVRFSSSDHGAARRSRQQSKAALPIDAGPQKVTKSVAVGSLSMAHDREMGWAVPAGEARAAPVELIRFAFLRQDRADLARGGRGRRGGPFRRRRHRPAPPAPQTSDQIRKTR